MTQPRVRAICGGAEMVQRGFDLAQIEECFPQVEMGSCPVRSQCQGAPKTPHGLARRAQIKFDATEPVPCVRQGLVEAERPTVLRRCLNELAFNLESVGVLRRKDPIIRIPRDRFAKLRGRLTTGPVRADLGGVFWDGSALSSAWGGKHSTTLAAHEINHLQRACISRPRPWTTA